MPKAEGRQRSSGQPTREDPIVQRATVEGLNVVYEQEGRGCSSGARPGRRPPHALEAVTVDREKRHSNWGRAADLRGVSAAIDPAMGGRGNT
jgi:hypothetical protein